MQLRGVFFFVGGGTAGLATATYKGEDRGNAFERADSSVDGGDVQGGLFERGARAPF